MKYKKQKKRTKKPLNGTKTKCHRDPHFLLQFKISSTNKRRVSEWADERTRSNGLLSFHGVHSNSACDARHCFRICIRICFSMPINRKLYFNFKVVTNATKNEYKRTYREIESERSKKKKIEENFQIERNKCACHLSVSPSVRPSIRSSVGLYTLHQPNVQAKRRFTFQMWVSHMRAEPPPNSECLRTIYALCCYHTLHSPTRM